MHVQDGVNDGGLGKHICHTTGRGGVGRKISYTPVAVNSRS